MSRKLSLTLFVMWTLVLAPVAPSQDRPSPFGAATRQTQPATRNTAGAENSADGQATAPLAAGQDPFPGEAAAMQQADLAWRAAKNQLDDINSGCVAGGGQLIANATAAKLKSLAAYAAYYQKVVEYWKKIRDASDDAEISGRAESAELQAHVSQLERELDLISRRKADLDRSLNENHVAGDAKALTDLATLEKNKSEQIDKARAALGLNSTGTGYILKRRQYAGQRMEEAKDLLQALRTEGYLYQALYETVGQRYSLACDVEMPRPTKFQSDWRDDVQRLGSPDQRDR